jgi:hypothetical protein
MASKAMKSDWLAMSAVFCIVFVVMLWVWLITGGVL